MELSKSTRISSRKKNSKSSTSEKTNVSRSIPPQLRRLIWETYMNKPRSAYGPCFVCADEIHITAFECGYVINGGLINLENLRPICSSCNKNIGVRDLFDYKDHFFKSIKKSSSPINIKSDHYISGCEFILIKGKRCMQKVTNKSNKYCRHHYNQKDSEGEIDESLEVHYSISVPSNDEIFTSTFDSCDNDNIILSSTFDSSDDDSEHLSSTFDSCHHDSF